MYGMKGWYLLSQHSPQGLNAGLWLPSRTFFFVPCCAMFSRKHCQDQYRALHVSKPD